MKHLLTLTLIAIIPFIMVGQQNLHKLKDVLLTVDNNKELLKNWDVDETREYNGIKILRMQGENDAYTRTNLSYYPSANQIAPAQIALFFDRRTPELANASVMTVQVIDAETNEVFFVHNFDKKDPYLFAGDVWYNYMTINIQPNFANSLVVKINDTGLGKEYKFMIYNIPVDIKPSDNLMTQTSR